MRSARTESATGIQQSSSGGLVLSASPRQTQRGNINDINIRLTLHPLGLYGSRLRLDTRRKNHDSVSGNLHRPHEY